VFGLPCEVALEVATVGFLAEEPELELSDTIGVAFDLLGGAEPITTSVVIVLGTIDVATRQMTGPDSSRKWRREVFALA
jgi:hypothetical protein